MWEAYSDFASVYDELMDNIPYDQWFKYIHQLLIEHGIKEGIVAELGCGTGTITEKLAQKGYDMIGIDYSDAMLDIANQKKASSGSSTLYLCQDMREFELYGTVAATISVCDSINYITEPEDLLQVFKLVNNYLDPGGVFIFDFHPRYYYKEVVADATIAEDRDNISFIWDNYYDEEENLNELALSLFIKDDTCKEDSNIYRKHQEFHLQKGYTLEEILNILAASGLELVAAYDAFTRNPATEECERIYIIAREKGKSKNSV